MQPFLTKLGGLADDLRLAELSQQGHMPQILVVTDSAEASASTVVYRERISIADLRSDHFSDPS